MSRARTIAAVLGTVLLIAGVLGFVAVGEYWISAGCPPGSLHGCSAPAPLSLENSTRVIVGSLIAVGVLVVGGVITFAALYLPDPAPSVSRKVAEMALEDSIRRGESPDAGRRPD